MLSSLKVEGRILVSRFTVVNNIIFICCRKPVTLFNLHNISTQTSINVHHWGFLPSWYVNCCDYFRDVIKTENIEMA
jgi:hypothetical protein